MIKPRKINLTPVTNLDDRNPEVTLSKPNILTSTQTSNQPHKNDDADEFVKDCFENSTLKTPVPITTEFPESKCIGCGKVVTTEDPLFDNNWLHITRGGGISEWKCDTCKPELIIPPECQSIHAARVACNKDKDSTIKSGDAFYSHAACKKEEPESKEETLPTNPLLLALHFTKGIGKKADHDFRAKQFNIIRKNKELSLADISNEYLTIYNDGLKTLKPHQHGRAVAIANKHLLKILSNLDK